AIGEIADHVARRGGKGDVHDNPGISVKLSALHPRYESNRSGPVIDELVPRLSALMEMARSANIGFSVDAEEADRLDLSLDVVEAALRNADLAGWDGFGLVVQAYGKSAIPVIDWFAQTAQTLKRRVALRLVKGAYWDFEIKNAQVTGMEAYPVFTRKQATDLSYLACAKRLMELSETIYPQFATHNAHTAAAILEMAGDFTGFEFQRLHGMGETLHDFLMADHGRRCRIYAPVGVHRDLLAYLVRRLLENGANSSFVNQLLDEDVPAADLAADPVAFMEQADPVRHLEIPLPPDLFAPRRRNSAGWNILNPVHAERLEQAIQPFKTQTWSAAALVGGKTGKGEGVPVFNPADPGDRVGEVIWSKADDVEQAMTAGKAAFASWRDRPADERASVLERSADLYEAHAGELMALLIREAGKTRLDAALELREAVDFFRYYALEARNDLASRERCGRGVFVCISPWNFPLAIFTGQIAAALAAGNCVIAKPAEQTPLTAMRAVRLMHEAGVPADVLALLPGDGAVVGAALVADRRADGVCFTGSTDTAIRIDRAMAETGNPRAPLIAETGGLNAMVVDSTALPEHAVRDIVVSAFQSAGQRCSALRVLFVQDDIADALLEMLAGAVMTLRVGNPWLAETDVGPVIDREAKQAIEAHCEQLRENDRQIFRHPVADAPEGGTFVAPQAIRLDAYGYLESEIFGPVLHVVRFAGEEIETVLADINRSGYGLTFGVHSRLDDRVEWFCKHAHAGNIYINRNQIGAVVGVQPFGGEGLSGTGPKAGGPLYLSVFSEQAGAPAAAPDVAVNVPAPKDTVSLADAMDRTRAALQVRQPGIADAKAIADHLPETFQTLARQTLERAQALLAEAGPLPGPTGESNDLAFYGRGTVLCLGGGEGHAASLCLQSVAALAAGNAIILPADSAGAMIGEAAGRAGCDDLVQLAADAGMPDAIAPLAGLGLVVHEGGPDELLAIRRALAERSGVRVPLVSLRQGLERLVIERVVSVDTTASGGNTTLLMLDD
ncbi:MAG TPA: bifunctional proline dehydrogenase/L-glutamate gamma-semialdehyde dehydrogenase PutA, partial [Afifellaceae bacterium]|nr:bifunctional proline dehydrogenase/L-glutamate gamma-semialdehyde dehydrogenase PutA [Afifellaceae bacterium]